MNYAASSYFIPRQLRLEQQAPEPSQGLQHNELQYNNQVYHIIFTTLNQSSAISLDGNKYAFVLQNNVIRCFMYSHYCGNSVLLKFLYNLFKVTLAGLCVVRNHMLLCVIPMGAEQFIQAMSI